MKDKKAPSLKADRKNETTKEITASSTEVEQLSLLEEQNKKSSQIIAALDIGSAKIACFIAEVSEDGAIEVIGIGHQASRGIKSGTIIDLKAAETAVAQTIQAAEYMARDRMQGQPLKSVFVNIPGVHTLSHQLSVDMKMNGRTINDRDVRAALLNAKSVEMPGRDQLIHAISSQYSIDGHHGIREPRGMAAHNFSVRMHAVTALQTSVRNLVHVVGQNLLDIDGVCAAPYAAGLSALVEDERQLGCTVIDMGGGTTSMGIFMEGKLVYSSAIPVGGIHITNDLARGLTTSLNDAERIKTLYGSAVVSTLDDKDLIDVPPIGEDDHATAHHVPRSLIVGIIQPRVEETFELIRTRLMESGLYQVSGRRVVLTGGASQLQGLVDLGQLILDKQIRLGRLTTAIKGLAEMASNPSFAGAAGLLEYAVHHLQDGGAHRSQNQSSFKPGAILSRVTEWLRENW